MLNIATKKINDLPVAIIDDFYSSDELLSIFREINFLKTKFKSPEESNGPGTSYVNGIPIKNNKGLYLDTCYSDRSISDILSINRKIFSKEVRNILESQHNFFRYISLSNSDTTKIHYYGDGDSYKEHNDSAVITVISWIFNEPKSFSGGDLIFENSLSVECLNNRVVVFPSCLYHEVTKVCMNLEDYQENGRYSISQFLCIGI